MDDEQDARERIAGFAALGGMMGLCNELAREGLLDRAAIGRIDAFMAQSVARKAGPAALKTEFYRDLGEFFSNLVRQE